MVHQIGLEKDKRRQREDRERQRKAEKDRERQRKTEKDRERQRKTEKGRERQEKTKRRQRKAEKDSDKRRGKRYQYMQRCACYQYPAVPLELFCCVCCVLLTTVL